MTRIMTHASVFSGIGGPEVAAAMLGWQNLFHCEINPFGKQVLDYWYPNAESYDDITTTDFSKWRGRVDVLTGGFPCQPFSYAGRRRGAEDDRYLWPYMFRCIDEIRPTWIVAENVAGILTMVEQGEVSEMASERTLFDEGDGIHRYKLRETFTLQRICDDLESHGYSVQPVLIPACAVGAPHRRDRVFIIGHRNVTDTGSCGQSASEQQGERAGQAVQQQAREQSFYGTCGQGASSASTDTDSMGRFERRCETDRWQQDKVGKELLTESKGQSSCGVPTDTADAGAESVRRERKDAVHGLGYAADTESQQCEWMRPQQPEDSGAQSRQFGGGGSEDGNIAGCGRWQGFPTVSPVHRGNDGLPFDVDDITIPFGKWRTESLKAYGNAIVPQVMYEIFRAIEQIETNK